jgi:hypothetical protein
MKPVSKATLQTIKRFPELYKRQALQVIDREQSEAIRITADSFVMASMLVLVDDFEFDEESIRHYVSCLQKTIDTSADYYEDAVAEGLRNRLHNHGIEYVLRGDKE